MVEQSDKLQAVIAAAIPVAPRSRKYLGDLRQLAAAKASELPHGCHLPHMSDRFCPIHMLEEVGGDIESLRELMQQDQAAFDATAATPWWPLPVTASWSSGISGGSVKLPSASSIQELIDYLQNRYSGPRGKHGFQLEQPGVRTVRIWGDRPAQVILHRPALITEHHRRLVKTGVWITSSPIIEMVFTPKTLRKDKINSGWREE